MDQMMRYSGCLLGLAVGDAIGTTVEFQARGSFPEMTDMVGGGPFHLPNGFWTDDTSMALCLGFSLLENGGFDPGDQMERYVKWYREGYLSSTGRCFDIGITVSGALRRFEMTRDPYSGRIDPNAAGNGCLMRLAPVPIRYASDDDWRTHARNSSRTTHGSMECLEATELMAGMLIRAFRGASKEEVLFGDDATWYSCPKVQAIALGEYRQKSRDEIFGAGYVIACLEAAAWCFWTTDDFSSAVLKAVNLGDDADTTGAVCGQIAGAFYGEEGIPGRWREQLKDSKAIRQLALDLGLAGLHPGSI